MLGYSCPNPGNFEFQPFGELQQEVFKISTFMTLGKKKTQTSFLDFCLGIRLI